MKIINMKKLFTLFVCGVFILSVIGYAEAQGSQSRELLTNAPAFNQLTAEERQNLQNLQPVQIQKITRAVVTATEARKLAALSETDREKLAYLTPSNMKRVLALNSQQIQAALTNVEVTRFNTPTEAFRVRPVAVSAVTAARNEVARVKNRLPLLKTAYANKLQAFTGIKTNLADCEDVATAECDQTRADTFQHAKDFALNLVNSLIEYVKLHIARIEENDQLTDAEAQEQLTRLNEVLAELEAVRVDIEAAETPEELKAALTQLKEIWRKHHHRPGLHRSRLVWKGLQGIKQKATHLAERMEKIQLWLDDQGTEVAGVDELIDQFYEKLEAVENTMTSAKSKFELAWEKRHSENDVDIEEIKTLVQEAFQEMSAARVTLKEAHDILKEIVRLMGPPLRQNIGTRVLNADLLDPVAVNLPQAITAVAADGSLTVVKNEPSLTAVGG